MLEMLGDWPHEVRWSPQVPLGAVLILVKPEGWGNDDPMTFHGTGPWSMLPVVFRAPVRIPDEDCV